MFNWIKNNVLKGGAKLGMVDELESIIDHKKIAMQRKDYQRIRQNMAMYRSEFPKVEYVNSNNKLVEREFRSLNVSKVLSRKMAKLVFNEGVNIEINDDDKADSFIKDVFKDSKFRKNFGEELEAGYAIGGLVLRPYYDSGSNKIKIAYAKPDSFFPISSTSNDISEIAFSTVTTVTEREKPVFYTLLEFHEWIDGQYVISNELYRSEDSKKLGNKVFLTALDKYKDLQPRNVLVNFSRPLFVYIKLAGKNNRNLYSPLSLGIIDNSKKQLKDINDKYDQFMWEIKQSEKKIIASEHFFKTNFDRRTGKPTTQFDDSTTSYRMIRSDEPQINEFNPALRSGEYIDAINFILQIIEIQTGFSPGTISFDGQSVKTATEIISENSETFSTRGDNVLIVEEAMKELITSIFELAAYHKLIKLPKELKISVDFDDGVFQSQDEKLTYYGKANSLGFYPKYKAAMDIFKVSEETAIEYVQAVNRELMGQNPIEQAAKQQEDIYGPGE